MLRGAVPVLRVREAEESARFYALLGFQREFAGRPDDAPDPCYAGYVREGARLHLSSFPGDGAMGGVVYLAVDDVDALYGELLAAGVPIVLRPTDQTWGTRELYVRDPDGNTLRFAQPLGR